MRPLASLITPLAVLAVVAVAGCGNARTQIPDVAGPQAPVGVVPVVLAAAGISFQAPANWLLLPGAAPLVATLTSGPATLAVWRYPRSQPVPATPSRLRRLEGGLVSAASARDPGLTLISKHVVVLGGHHAIQVVGLEHIAGMLRRVRSEHLFIGGAEVVFDAIAPVGDFLGVDHAVFAPLLRSARVKGVG